MSDEPALHLVGHSLPPDMPEAPAAHTHVVQFYDDDRVLYANVVKFVAAGLALGEPAVIIGTEAHRRAFLDELGALGRSAILTQTLVLLDARETLATFMVNGEPDWDKFRAAVGSVLERASASAGGKPVRAYGEMVDLLWRDGNRTAALKLEGYWNDLSEIRSFALLCAYVMGNFCKAGDTEMFHSVCRAHTQVIPTGPAKLARHDEQQREITLLQQRALALETELAHRKELEQALREALQRETAARSEAERNVRYNEMFAGILGHDLRNPLGAINMGANYLMRSSGGGEKVSKAATRILSSAERMSRMIDQLLDFTRIRVGGGLPLTRTPLDLAELCHRVKDELEAANPDCVITIETSGYTQGEWDYDRLLQVFSNLVGNAISHGARSCAVHVIADGRSPAQVTVVVHNDGVVSPEILPVMFDPFRGSNKQQKTKGLGLGLFITQQIVIAHGGTIEVASEEGQGTTLKVTLPRSRHAL